MNRTFRLIAMLASSIVGTWSAFTRADTNPPVINECVSLADALRIADTNSLSIQQSRADADAARSSAYAVRAQEKLSVSATTYATTGDSTNILTSSPGASPQNIFIVPPQGFVDQDVTVMLPIFTGGRLHSAAKSAESQADSFDGNVCAARLSSEESVALAYVNGALMAALVDVSQSRVNAEDEQVRVTQEKTDAGKLAPVDLLREQAEDADAKQALLKATNDAELALIDLKQSLGVSQTSVVTLSDRLATLEESANNLPASMADAISIARAERPEFLSVVKMIDAASEQVGVAKAAYSPQVYAVGMGDASAQQGLSHVGYTVGITASIPLYDGGARKADEDAAKSKANRAREDETGIELSIEHDVAAAWLNWQTAQSELAGAQDGVTAATEGYRLVDLRYNAGKSIAAERLDALAAKTRSEGILAQANADIVAGRIKLLGAIGRAPL